MQYIADQVPAQTIYPRELRARADVNRWLFWCAQHWSGPLGVFTWENWMKALFGGGERDQAAVARAEGQFDTVATLLDVHLAGKKWLSGEGVTIADFAIATPLMRVKEATIPIERFANLQAWFERVKELDAWKRTEP